MNKVELIARMAEVGEMTKKAAGENLDVIVKVITDALVEGDEVKISGFGTFCIADRAAREGRNPQTGEALIIAASKVPKFKASKALKEAVNG